MAEIDLGIAWESETQDATQGALDARNRNRRDRIERQKYDAMQKADKQRLALEKLQSDEFQTVFKRYYSGGISDINGGKKIEDFSKSEMIEKFYQDRIWSEYNTVGIANDV